MWRRTDSAREHARKMELAKAGDMSKICERDIVSNVGRNVVEDTTEPRITVAMWDRTDQLRGSTIAVSVKKLRGE
jgi:hypothetical protein